MGICSCEGFGVLIIPSRSTRLPDYPGSAGLGFTIITRDMMSETPENLTSFEVILLRFIIIIYVCAFSWNLIKILFPCPWDFKPFYVLATGSGTYNT